MGTIFVFDKYSDRQVNRSNGAIKPIFVDRCSVFVFIDIILICDPLYSGKIHLNVRKCERDGENQSNGGYSHILCG